MAFMVPVAEHMAAYHVETNAGTEIVPEDVCGVLNLNVDGMPDDVRTLLPYLEHPRIAGVERKEGWYGRLSASGYLDCTSWDGPYATADEALDAVKEAFDCDDEGDATKGHEMYANRVRRESF